MELSIGDTARVLDAGCTYDAYYMWHDIHCVPHFAQPVDGSGEVPQEGKVYQVTHVGKHGDGNATLYVLDGRYIVDAGAFQKKPIDHADFSF